MERKGALDRTLTPWGPFSGGEMGSLIRSHDWATTSLGPMDTWPQSIRTAIQMMLAMPQPVCLWWGEEPRLLYNDDYRTILGSKHPHALGRTMTEVWPEIVDTVEHPLNTVRAHGPQRLVDREFALGAEGERRSRWFTSTWTPIHHESGAVVGVFNVSTETTDRVLAERELRESEERQTFLLKLNDALRPVADPVKIQEVVARTLGEYLRASRVTYAEIRGDEAIIEREYTVDVPSLVGSHRLSSYGDHMRQRFECGQTDVVTDTLADPSLSPEQRTAYEAMSSRAHITATVTKEGRPVAAMVVQDRYPRQWTRDEVGLVEEAAERAWAAVERAKAEKALNTEHARLDAIITTLPIGLLFMDADRGITMANEEARRIWTAAKSLEQMHDVDFRAFWPETGEPLQIEEWPAE